MENLRAQKFESQDKLTNLVLLHFVSNDNIGGHCAYHVGQTGESREAQLLIEHNHGNYDLEWGTPQQVQIGHQIHELLCIHRHQIHNLTNRRSLSSLTAQDKRLNIQKYCFSNKTDKTLKCLEGLRLHQTSASVDPFQFTFGWSEKKRILFKLSPGCRYSYWVLDNFQI